MSKKAIEVADEKTGEVFQAYPIHRHPALAARDAGYAAAPRHPRLRDFDGKLAVDPMPVAKELIGIRPLTLDEQVARFSSGVIDFRLIADERFTDVLLRKAGYEPDKFLSDEDWHDYLDDMPEDGLSPFEIAARQNILQYDELGFVYVDGKAPSYSPTAPEPERSHEAGEGEGAASGTEATPQK